MAKIPDATALGPRPVPGPARAPIVRDQSGAIISDAVYRAGAAIGREAEKRRALEDGLNYQRGKNAMLVAHNETMRALEDVKDYTTWEREYNDRMARAKEQATGLIRSEHDRAIFDMEAQQTITAGVGKVHEQALKREVDDDRANLNGLLDTSRKNALDTSDPEIRQAFISSGKDAIRAAQEKGSITSQEAEDMDAKWTRDVAEGMLVMMDAEQRVAALSKPEGTIAEALHPDTRAVMLRQAMAENKTTRNRASAQSESDRIMAAHPESLKDGMAAARRIQDPDVRALVEDDIKLRHNELKAIEAQEADDRFERAATQVEAGVSPQAIPAREWVKLSLTEKRALEARYAELNGVAKVETDWQVYYGLIGTANVAPDDFKKIDLRRHFADLGETERKELIKLQGTLLGEEQTEPSGLITRKDVVDDALESMGVTTAHQKGARRAEMAQEEVAFRRAVDDQIRAIESNQGKPATVEQIQDVVDRMTLDVRVSRAWRTDPSKRAMQLTDDERQRAYVELGKVPEDDVAFIRNMFLSHGSEPTDEEMGRAYFRYVENDRDGFFAVVEGRE